MIRTFSLGSFTLGLMLGTTVLVFQNCAPASIEESTSLNSLNTSEVTDTPKVFGANTPAGYSTPSFEVTSVPQSGGENLYGIETSDVAVVTESDILLTPETLVSMPSEILVNAPANCEATCQAELGCAGPNVSDSDRPACINQCNRVNGMCAPYNLPNDPNVITSFTVPAGYKKASISVEHCTDRQDVMIVEGPYLAFKTMNPARLHTGNGWRNMNSLGANVGRGPDCKKLGLRDVAKVKVRLQNEDGSMGSSRTFLWKFPGALSFSLNMIQDIDLNEPVFLALTGFEGPGIKQQKIYDNYLNKGQLSFVFEYLFWYDPKYETRFDFWYKKGTNSQFDPNTLNL